MTCHYAKGGDPTTDNYLTIGGSFDPVAFSNRGNDVESFETLRADCNGALPMIAFAQNTRDEVRMMPYAGALGAQPGMKQQTCVAFTASEQANGFAWERDVYPALDAQVPNDSSNIQKGIRLGMQVRRLTPIETARLQGVPDDHCRIPYRGRMMADGPIYKMHGNGFAVPVVRWIGQRIKEVL